MAISFDSKRREIIGGGDRIEDKSSNALRTQREEARDKSSNFVIKRSEAKNSAETDVLHQARARERNEEREKEGQQRRV